MLSHIATAPPLKALMVVLFAIATGCAQSATPDAVAATVAAEGEASDQTGASRARRIEAEERGVAHADADLRWADERDKAGTQPSSR